MTENIVAVDITPIKHDEFKKPPPTPMFRFSTTKQLHRNLEYIANAKIIVDDNATLGSLKPQEQVELDQLYNRRSINAFIYYIDIDSKVFLCVSLADNQHLLSALDPKERIQDNLNLKTRYRVRRATGSAGIFGKAVWTTSERIKQEEEARRHELFLRTEVSESIVSQNDYLHQLHQNTSNLADTDVWHSSGSYIPQTPQQRLFVANPNSRNTSTVASFPDVQQSIALHIPPGLQQELFIANPNSRNTSVEGSLPDVQNSSGLYISSGPQQTLYFISPNSRNTSTEGLPPSTQMGSNLSLSRQTVMTGSSGPGCYPRSGSVNTASLEDDGTHFSIGSRASGSSEIYQLDPSTGHYSGEPSSPRYPAMYNSGQEYYRNQTQMATPYSSYPPPQASISTDRHGRYHHSSEDPGHHDIRHNDAHKPRGYRSAHPEARTQRH
ncbi:uncharacterized protein C8R40DRAFT_1165302 [Lentinula edodes]|uniref:uncharacterized protein n=1 Tax=Lentinula edodes TaxID=5353 RepID=UPI001E8D6D28|nr:uncharacterized protein C8R40DRAFT_1165302 [Lentinula edodes]KAH7880333.1 hypothetical protein C8R40DRAFT_1165302 [Lentinula edodes]